MARSENGDWSSEEATGNAPIDSPSEKCRTPKLKELKEENTLKEILDTHTWQIIEAKVYDGGFQVRVRCSRCGLGRISMLYNVKESEKNAKSLREN